MQKKKLFFKKKGLNIKIWQKIQRKVAFPPAESCRNGFLLKIFHNDFHGGRFRHRNPFRFRVLGAEPGILAARKLPCRRRNPVMQFIPAQPAVQIFSDLTITENLPCGRRIVQPFPNEPLRFVDPA